MSIIIEQVYLCTKLVAEMSSESIETGIVVSPGTVIVERYEVVERLGKGGMGTVVKVIDRALDNDIIALKILYPHLVEDKVVFARFRNEVLVARQLAHPNIVRLYDFGKAGAGSYYISMEYVQGTNLADLIYGPKSTKLTFEEALKVLYEISLGMQHAHSKGVIHRDIKPDNILVSQLGEVKITDLGLARTITVDKGFTNTGEAVGTPYYMSPEQIRGAEPDKRSDIYGFAILAFELATGRRPFYDEDWFNLAAMHINKPLPKLINKQNGIPQWFEDFVHVAGAKKAEDRFQSFEEVLDILHDKMEDSPLPWKRLPSVFAGSNIKKRKRRIAQRSAKRAARRIVGGCGVMLGLAAVLGAVRLSPSLQSVIAGSVLRLEQSFDTRLSTLQTIIGTDITYSEDSLLKAATEGDSKTVSALLHAGLSVNTIDEERNTLLHLAAKSGDVDTVKNILSFSPDIHANNNSGETSLMLAINSQRGEIVSALLEVGSEINVRDAQGWTPLIHAINSNDISIVRMLVKHNADINLADTEGRTPLHHAVEMQDSNLVYEFIDKEVDVNALDATGWTPLMVAAHSKQPQLIRMLLANGAEQSIQNNEGNRAVDLVGDNQNLRNLILLSGSGSATRRPIRPASISRNFQKAEESTDAVISFTPEKTRLRVVNFRQSDVLWAEVKNGYLLNSLSVEVKNTGSIEASAVAVTVDVGRDTVTLEGPETIEARGSATYVLSNDDKNKFPNRTNRLSRPKVDCENCR